jgi:hypothetical protein
MRASSVPRGRFVIVRRNRMGCMRLDVAITVTVLCADIDAPPE